MKKREQTFGPFRVFQTAPNGVWVRAWVHAYIQPTHMDYRDANSLAAQLTKAAERAEIWSADEGKEAHNAL